MRRPDTSDIHDARILVFGPDLQLNRHGAASCRCATRPVLRTRPGHPVQVIVALSWRRFVVVVRQGRFGAIPKFVNRDFSGIDEYEHSISLVLPPLTPLARRLVPPAGTTLFESVPATPLAGLIDLVV